MSATKALLLPGTTAKVTGLQSKPALNGCAAIVGAYLSEKERYEVRVISPEQNNFVSIALKRDNLEQGAASKYPPVDVLASDEYSISDCILVMEVVDSSEEYEANVAVACLTRYVQSLMDGPTPALPPARVLYAAMHAMVTNARNEGAAPHLFSVAVLTLPFILNDRSDTVMVEDAENKLECSLLNLLVQGMGCYGHVPEILSSTMIALRQLLTCWTSPSDGAVLENDREKAVLSSGLLTALVKVCERYTPPKRADDGILELCAHAFAAFSTIAGASPRPGLAKALASAGVVGIGLRSMANIAKVAEESSHASDATKHISGGKAANGATMGAPQQLSPAALEFLQADSALLKALSSTPVGRLYMRRAGGVTTFETLSSLSCIKEELAEVRRRLEIAEAISERVDHLDLDLPHSDTDDSNQPPVLL